MRKTSCFVLLVTTCVLLGSICNHASAQGLTVKSSKKASSKKPDSAPAEETTANKVKPTKDISPPKTSKPTTKSDSKKEEPTPVEGVTFSNPIKNKWKVGVKARGGGGTVGNAIFTFSVPKDWPEQSVLMVEDEVPPNARLGDQRKQDIGLEQLVVILPTIPPRQEVLITKTFLVTNSQINPPKDTTNFIRPKSRVNEARKYLRPSPGINFSSSKIKRQVKELAKEKSTVWEEVEAIYDWVRDNIEDATTEPRQIASVFIEKSGCNEDKVSLFVGMCRSAKVPARMVWAQGTIYAEFMLTDAAGTIHWFPCNIGGLREFGSYAEPKIILQKGDNFRVPEKDKNLKYVSEVFQGQIQKGRSKPVYQFFTLLLPVDE